MSAQAFSRVDGPVAIGVGAAIRSGDEAWVLIEDRVDRGLGVGVAWMQRSGATSLRLLVGGTPENDVSGILARRAAQFEIDIEVREVRDRDLVPVEPVAHRPEAEPTAEHLDLVSQIRDCGADVVIEHGTVSGEVLGLEVCRVVDDPSTGRARLDVGVGVHDREAFAMLHADTPAADSLRRIVDVVRGHRQPGADPHPLNRLASERALRSRALIDPMCIGARNLRAVSTVVVRRNVKDPAPCAAIGETASGEPVVAVFSAGIDLDVVPVSADTRAWHGYPEARLVIAVPERDASPVTHRLAAGLRRPATIVPIPSS